MDSRILTGFNDEGFGSLQDCASLAAAGYCDSWFTHFAHMRGIVIAHAVIVVLPQLRRRRETTTEVLEPAAFESPFETVVVSGNAVVVDCPLSDTAILPIFIKPEPDGPRLELRMSSFKVPSKMKT